MVSQAEFSYEDRYGIKPTPRWRAGATIIAILGIIWVFWAGLHHANPDVRFTLISFTPTGDKSITLRYEIVRRNTDDTIRCTLIARDFDKNTIGQIEDVIPAGERVVTREVAIPTRTKPVNGAVSDCSVK